jgi:Ca-activated chloride channel homolog
MTSLKPHSAVLAVLAALASTVMWDPAGGQTPPTPSPRPTPQWRGRVDVVMVTATVRDAEGRLVTGLTSDDFRVFEDGEPQALTQFVSDRVPVSLGILLDVSESMVGRRIEDARLALRRFVSDLLDAEDEAFLIAFNHRPRDIAPWTPAPAQLAGRLDTVVPTGGTAIYDALDYALPRFRERSHQRAALVVISDGADTASDIGLPKLRAELRRSDAFVYAIAIDQPGRRPVSGRPDPYALRELTDDSGGYTEIVRDSADLVEATARIAEELNSQYLLGYAAPRPADGAFHSIRVRPRDPSLKIRYRRGYVAER